MYQHSQSEGAAWHRRWHSKGIGDVPPTRYKYCILTLILVFLSTIIDMAGYYKSGNNSGVFGRIAFLLFILVLGLEASRQTVARLKKGRRIGELEQFALNDSMTGMYNRNAYDYYINKIGRAHV